MATLIGLKIIRKLVNNGKTKIYGKAKILLR